MTRAGDEIAPPAHLFINRCNLPARILASAEFNLLPIPIRIDGVEQSNRHLFDRLNAIPDPFARGQVFHDYLDVKFALHQWSEHSGKARTSLRNSYIRFLCGWGVDSNGIEGAVMKSWVQSRFGLLPTYHCGRLTHLPGEEDQRFAIDRMRGSARTNAIFQQLDLLYAFCQYEMARRWPGRETLTLYRGTNDPEEHPVLSRQAGRRSCVRLNNLVSFTDNRERAWEFGSTVWETVVASTKVVFFSGLLPDHFLRGEGEFLVIGGDYWVKELLY